MTRFGRILGSLFGSVARNAVSAYDKFFDGPSFGSMAPSRVRSWFAKYATNGTLQSVVRRVCWDVALVKWRVYREIPGTMGADGPQLQLIYDHTLERLWKKPCPYLTGYQFRYLTQLYLELDGEAFIVLERPPGQLAPKALWVIPSTWVMKRPSENDPVWQVCIGSRWETLPAGEVIWLHDPDPADPYGRGLGVARSVDDDVQQDEWMNKFNNQFFRQGGHPGQVFAIEGVEQTQATQMQAAYEAKYQGFWNAFKTAWIGAPKGGSIKVHQLGPSHKDMDFVQGKTSKRDGIMLPWNMPRFELGISEDVNRASAQASDYTKSKNVTLPRIIYLEEAWNCWLTPLFRDPRLRLVPDPVVKQTEEFRLAKSSEGWLSGALKRNQWLATNGYDPINGPEGEEYSPQAQAMVKAGQREQQQARLLSQIREIDPDGAAILENTWRRMHG